MNNMTDIIEKYIKELFNESNENYITLKRSNVAEKFDCVPSQLNYVIKTRFTQEHGFLIESKRGGGGFIKITKIKLRNNLDYFDYLIKTVQNEQPENIDYNKILKILKDENYISHYDYTIIATAINSLSEHTLDLINFAKIKDDNIIFEIEQQAFSKTKEMMLKFLTTIKYNKENK